MKRELHAYMDGAAVGVFREAGPGRAEFRYHEDYRGTPLSLSLPIGEAASPEAAYRYLENLLPDADQVRQRWAAYRGLETSDAFSLLSVYGEDVAGAVVLSGDPDLLDREPEGPELAVDDEIVERIKEIRNDPHAWTGPNRRYKMSLGGAQGKFSLARQGQAWYWSNAQMPSTHIFKPESKRFRWLAHAEHLGLELARKSGLSASKSTVATVRGMDVFVTKRWDRHEGRRIHAEDLNQVLARPTDQKYESTAQIWSRR